MAARDLITKDFLWKFFSLALAIAIWVTVSAVSRQNLPGIGNTRTAQRVFPKLPVVVMSTAGDVREFSVSPDYVEVTVSGRPEMVSGLTDREIRVTVDLTDIESAQDLHKRVDVSTPPGITFVGAFPVQVDVVIPAKKFQKNEQN